MDQSSNNLANTNSDRVCRHRLRSPNLGTSNNSFWIGAHCGLDFYCRICARFHDDRTGKLGMRPEQNI
jgi:hypothetical protein